MVNMDKNNFLMTSLNDVKKVISVRSFHRIGFNESTNFSHACSVKNSCESEFADQMAFLEFSPDWILKES